MHDIKNKHLILDYSNSVFLKLYTDMLLEKCNCSPDELRIISIDQNKSTPKKINNIPIYYFDSLTDDDFQQCQTITAISLSSLNSKQIQKIIQNKENIKKLYIHITDDEIARWIETKNKYGSLIPTNKNYTDEACIKVLNEITNLIAPEEYFLKRLKYLLPNKNFKFIDARDAFKSLPSELWDKFSNLYNTNTSETLPEKSIFIGPKRDAFGLFDTISIIKNLQNKGLLPEYKLLLFTHKKKKHIRIIIDLYLSYLRHIKKCNVDIAYPTVTNALTYNALIMSCSHLILQKRGSMSTARSYLSLGRGVVHVQKNSPNHQELCFSENVDIAEYENFSELANNIKSNNINIPNNTRKILSRYNEKYDKLKKIYK
ncbi:TPA: hypothetical protein RZA60_001650 [Vibrio vulnificus]|nr:hypothetical protein [Vibrio vulnificus]HDY7623938.1 hypothetical protein [Vibrio vulnificus]HEB2781326.1 hypothetical protein [Vibrio vulnificus]